MQHIFKPLTFGFMVLGLLVSSSALAHDRHHHKKSYDKGHYVVIYKDVPRHEKNYRHRHYRHYVDKQQEKGYYPKKRRAKPLRERLSTHLPAYRDHYRDGIAIRIYRHF